MTILSSLQFVLIILLITSDCHLATYQSWFHLVLLWFLAFTIYWYRRCQRIFSSLFGSEWTCSANECLTYFFCSCCRCWALWASFRKRWSIYWAYLASSLEVACSSLDQMTANAVDEQYHRDLCWCLDFCRSTYCCPYYQKLKWLRTSTGVAQPHHLLAPAAPYPCLWADYR